jgi:hypothetical protein
MRRTLVAIKILKEEYYMARQRKIIQIATCGVDNVQSTQCNAILYALCDDGSLFGRCNNDDAWWQVPSVPDAPDIVE